MTGPIYQECENCHAIVPRSYLIREGCKKCQRPEIWDAYDPNDYTELKREFRREFPEDEMDMWAIGAKMPDQKYGAASHKQENKGKCQSAGGKAQRQKYPMQGFNSSTGKKGNEIMRRNKKIKEGADPSEISEPQMPQSWLRKTGRVKLDEPEITRPDTVD